jgi:hypothetical protein
MICCVDRLNPRLLEVELCGFRQLLSWGEIGRTYAPALLANAQALQAGRDQMQTTIDGQPWEQPVFPYQAKCLQWINAEYHKLESGHQAQVDEILAGTGCETLIFRDNS